MPEIEVGRAPHTARLRFVQPGHRSQQRRFAAAVWTREFQGSARGKFEREVPKQPAPIANAAEIAQRKQDRAAGLSRHG
jgi:hypothetical protein